MINLQCSFWIVNNCNIPFPRRFQSCRVNGGRWGLSGIWGLSRWWSSRVHEFFLWKLKYKKMGPQKTDQSGEDWPIRIRGRHKLLIFPFFQISSWSSSITDDIIPVMTSQKRLISWVDWFYTNIQIREIWDRFLVNSESSITAKWSLPPLTTFSPTHFHIKIAFQLLS